jgi:long-chain fatty acid transport protein
MRKLALLLLVTALVALPLAAQNVDIEALSGLQFNFGNPGARSLAMGGAFLGLADDASAAEANPAGLTILRKPEVSIELRNFAEEQSFTTSGTFPEINRTAFAHHSDAAVVSFASVVYPIKNFTFGLYYHEPLNNEGGGVVAPQQDDFTGVTTPLPDFYMPTERIPGTNDVKYVGDPITRAECLARRQQMNDPFACIQSFINPFISALSVRQRTFGVAGAWQVHPRFSVGVTARHQRFNEEAATLRYNSRFQLQQVIVQATAEVGDNGELKQVEQTDLTFSVGFKWSPTDWMSVGGVYKQGPEFDAPVFYADINTGLDFIPPVPTTFHSPDIVGLGVSFRPIPALTVNADAVRVSYSTLVDNFVAVTPGVGDIEEPFLADDAVELRFGAEYLFPTKIPVAIRGGYWRDPAHGVKWNGPLNDPNFVAEALLFPGSEDQNHYTIGAGLAWPRFQIDVAYDTSDTYKVGSISMVTRF